MPSVVLVCAAHPDDEVLGCGATMARHAAHGDEVHVLIVAQGLFSREGASAAAHDDLRAACNEANARLGVASVTMLDFPDNRLDTVALLDLAKAIEAQIAACRPQIVYTHSAGDLNVDHVRVHDAVAVAARPQPGACVRELYAFEVQSATGWRPGAVFAPVVFVDVSQTLEAKLAALRAYESEMRPFPHARSLEAVEHQARWRGSLAGLAAAEAFELCRRIEGPTN